MLTQQLINTVLQLLAFCLVPFVVYLFTRRRQESFFRYVGLYNAPRRAYLYALAVSLLISGSAIILLFLDDALREIMTKPPTITGQIHVLGFSGQAVVLVLLIAVFKTALAEEILFRGFIGKQLMLGLGYRWGNVVQSVLFGALHAALFLAFDQVAPGFIVFALLLSTVAGFVLGYLHHKVAGGSILPGWVAHALGNVLSYSVIGFLV